MWVQEDDLSTAQGIWGLACMWTVAPLTGIFEEGTSKGKKAWMVQACQNRPDEKSLVFEEGTSKGHKAWTVQACQNWPDEKSLVLEATHFVFRLAGLLTFLSLCSDNR